MKHILRILRHPIRYLRRNKEERRHAMVGPAHHWKMKRDFQFQFLKTMDLRPEHYLLDIGCGTLRGGIPLITYLQDRHYFGVEVREKALNEGRKELREAGLEAKSPSLLLCPDISQLVVDQEFDYILAFSVLIHMGDDTLDDTLNFVSRHLSDGGVFYANVNIGERKEGKWQGFPVVARTFEFYIYACAKNGLGVSDLGPLKDHGHISNEKSQDSQRMLRINKNADKA